MIDSVSAIGRGANAFLNGDSNNKDETGLFSKKELVQTLFSKAQEDIQARFHKKRGALESAGGALTGRVAQGAQNLGRMVDEDSPTETGRLLVAVSNKMGKKSKHLNRAAKKSNVAGAKHRLAAQRKGVVGVIRTGAIVASEVAQHADSIDRAAESMGRAADRASRLFEQVSNFSNSSYKPVVVSKQNRSELVSETPEKTKAQKREELRSRRLAREKRKWGGAPKRRSIQSLESSWVMVDDPNDLKDSWVVVNKHQVKASQMKDAMSEGLGKVVNHLSSGKQKVLDKVEEQLVKKLKKTSKEKMKNFFGARIAQTVSDMKVVLEDEVKGILSPKKVGKK